MKSHEKPNQITVGSLEGSENAVLLPVGTGNRFISHLGERLDCLNGIVRMNHVSV